MTRPQLRPLALSLLLAFGLAACGGGGGIGTGGTGASAQGVLIDDLVIGATVFCDLDGDSQLDSGEASATTDDNGRYDIAGCSSGTLTSVAGTGYDRTTLRAPKGSFKARRGGSVVSPFTTLQLASGLDDTAFPAVLAKLGLSGVDAHSFEPTDNTRGPKAAAIAKILNEIADAVESLGGDPATAFSAAVSALVANVQDTPAGTDLATDAVARNAAIRAAAVAALDTLPVGTLTGTAKTRAADLLAEGLQRITARIAAKTRYDDIRDDFNNGVVTSIVSGTDLDDDAAYDGARNECRDDDGMGRARHIAARDDTFELVGPTLEGGSRSITLSQFASGVDLRGLRLADLTALRLPLTADVRALPGNGRKVAVGLSVRDVAAPNGRTLQFLLDDLRLSRDAGTGQVRLTLSRNSELYFYARSSSGVEFGTGRNGFEDMDTSLLSNPEGGASLDLSRLAAGMKGKFPANTALIDQMLSGTGTFEVTLVVSEVDLRLADGTPFPRGNVAVSIPGASGIAERVRGTAVTGRLTF
ncbi:hypothetical protein [Sphaerotilus mobilis]|uniref:Uncharacterized protein n=1 Tax=Sphaerotilus mobilis TaxID=47994 RepID=A0A4Q7LCH4_9BURK|nr:hypothetical protein [Sphaerotilus mobilis]RZS52085.1 hypothetical protein EV685_3274 [Sphaerotilus mobilis]